ncbi:MAG: efflux RND transporter permease subunit [Methanocellales archaeon]|nr:efflux RND transporter permease subunit [Methanocellales archaeon]MDD3291768.1 efflux RND transporter permease subunit [Methanocellales archaeon]MDD5235118.1 efflux RND transporter permease subunit [Methanocellales archaeon]MDD5485256.1 efflux RND transporter permease subunit [Methanocellales archaeon]
MEALSVQGLHDLLAGLINGISARVGLGKLLFNLADFQFKNYKTIIMVTLILTAFFAFGATQIQMQTDLSEEMPEDMPSIVLQKRISSKFSGEDMIIIAVRLDPSTDTKNPPSDIRDPRVIESVAALQEQLSEETSIESVQSVASLFQMGIPNTLDGVKNTLSYVPQSSQFFNRDYSATLIYASTTLGGGEEDVKEVTSMMQMNIDSVPKPAGVKYSITGNAPIQDQLLTVLQEDVIYTTSIAAIIILLLLFVLQRSITKGFLVFVPLPFGLIWAFGLMGWLNIPLSVVTISMGPLALGLGVEYGVFFVSRYQEERSAGRTQLESLRVAVPGIGTAVTSSAATTIVGFMALTMASMPMIQHLGVTLALAIFCILISAIIFNPCVVLLEENIESRRSSNAHAFPGRRKLGEINKRV